MNVFDKMFQQNEGSNNLNFQVTQSFIVHCFMGDIKAVQDYFESARTQAQPEIFFEKYLMFWAFKRSTRHIELLRYLWSKTPIEKSLLASLYLDAIDRKLFKAVEFFVLDLRVDTTLLEGFTNRTDPFDVSVQQMLKTLKEKSALEQYVPHTEHNQLFKL